MRLLISFIFALFLAIAWTNQSFACSCIAPEWPRESIEKSSEVFVWKVTKIEDSIIKQQFWQLNTKKVSIEVSNNIKWEEALNKIVFTSSSSASCWYNFEIWESYIVYANENDWKLQTWLCSRTNKTENATKDLEELLVESQEYIDDEWLNDFLSEEYTNEDIENKVWISNHLIVLVLIILSLLLIALWVKNKKS